MRKNLYLGLMACAALTMTGCSNNEVIENAAQQSGKAIQFSTYLGKSVQGRAQDLTSSNINDFGVFASYTKSDDWAATNTMNFMFDQKVEKSGSAWNYTPLKYWPEKNGEKISFFAYAPYTYKANDAVESTATITAATGYDKSKTGAPKVNFVINPVATHMVDFTAGVKMNVSPTLANNEEQNKVTFTLHHELARVNFAAKLDRDAFSSSGVANKTKVNITAIKIVAGGGFNKSADYQFATTNDVTGANPTYTKGTWSNLVAATEELDVTPILNKVAPTDLGDYTTLGVFLLNDANEESESEVALFQTNQYLFLIPNPNDATGNISVTITYDIVTADAALDGEYTSSTATKTVQIPAKNFTQGHAKKYVFTFGLQEVKVASTVEAWPVETAGDETEVNGTDTDAN